MYLNRAYYILMPISGNVSFLTKNQIGERNWTKFSVTFINLVISSRRFGHWSTKSHSWLNLYTHLIAVLLCIFFRNTLIWGLPVRWLIFKKRLSVEADAASVFMCGKTNWLVNKKQWAILCHSIATHTQAAAISILITKLEILMAVRVCLNSLQTSGYFT
jgi:hypothetical protein